MRNAGAQCSCPDLCASICSGHRLWIFHLEFDFDLNFDSDFDFDLDCDSDFEFAKHQEEAEQYEFVGVFRSVSSTVTVYRLTGLYCESGRSLAMIG